jgi:addiction module HigA family antidote
MTEKRRSLRNPNRPPVHPGAVLSDIVLDGDGPSRSEFASALGISRQMLHGLLTEKHGVSAEMAVKLGHVLGNGPEIWIRLQQAHDLWHAERSVDTSKLRVLHSPSRAA